MDFLSAAERDYSQHSSINVDFVDRPSRNILNFGFAQLCCHHPQDESSQHEMGSTSPILLVNFGNFRPRTGINSSISSGLDIVAV